MKEQLNNPDLDHRIQLAVFFEQHKLNVSNVLNEPNAENNVKCGDLAPVPLFMKSLVQFVNNVPKIPNRNLQTVNRPTGLSAIWVL